MSKEIDISIITVGYKSCERVRELLISLFAARGTLSIEYFVIDNASDDGLISMVEKDFVPRSDDTLKIITIQNSTNLGFAAANNIGIKRSFGRYVLLHNPDMRLFPDTLTQMVAWMDNTPEAGIAGCKLITSEGNALLHVRRFPRVYDQLAILLKVPHIFPAVLNSYLATDFNYDVSARVDSIRGSFFMIHRNVIERLGNLDERFFIWFEEVDYCKQAALHGIEVWYNSAATCIDYVGQSFSLVSGLQKQNYFTDSMIKYFEKWHPRTAWIFRALRPFALAAAWITEKIKS